jgi:DNA-binding winged helix-turn-helix (wHTH) protein
MVDGEPRDEKLLLAAADRAQLSVCIENVGRGDVGLQVAQSLDPSCRLSVRAGEPREARCRALLFDAWGGVSDVQRMIGALGAEPSLDNVLKFIAVKLAQSDWFDALSGFDDFMLEPWSAAELYARIQVAELRRGELTPEARLAVDGIAMDSVARQANVAGQSIHLTSREFALLSYLSQCRGRVLARDHLLEHVWGQSYQGGARTVDVHIRRLRSKFGSALRIQTVRGGGYRLDGKGKLGAVTSAAAPEQGALKEQPSAERENDSRHVPRSMSARAVGVGVAEDAYRPCG